jgi:predicted small secreted protein
MRSDKGSIMKRPIPVRTAALVLVATVLVSCATHRPRGEYVPRQIQVASADTTTLPTEPNPAGAKLSAEALNKKSQNPIASLISLPLQNNTNFNAGPDDKTTNVLNVQPVLPLALSEDWNLITRLVLPVVYVPKDVVPGANEAFGLGDSLLSGFFSPQSSGDFTWGAGPVLLLPTKTDDALGAGEWGLGPTAVAVWTPGKWVVGGLVNNIWSVEGNVNQMILNPFINYNLPNSWALQTLPIITANWKADSGNQWTVPLGGGVSKLVKVGNQPIVFGLGAYHNVVRPDHAPDWTLQFSIKFLFPK